MPFFKTNFSQGDFSDINYSNEFTFLQDSLK